MCDCIEKVNEKLKEHNKQLELVIFFDGTPSRVMIHTVKVERRGKGRDGFLAANYCPICGEKYPDSSNIKE